MPPDRRLEAETKHTMDVTNLAVKLMRAQDFDRTNIACGVAITAKVIAGDDPVARMVLAKVMREIANEIDDVADASLQ